ncbi:acetyltransferase [Candidatus Cloacimonadaceae bacterium]
MQLIVIGGFSEIFELCADAGLAIAGYVDSSELPSFLQYEYFGNDEEFINICTDPSKFGLVISPDQPQVRNRLFRTYNSMGFNYPVITSRYAKVSPSSVIGMGSVLQHGVFVSANVILGDFVKCNVYANIMHDTVIGSFSTIAPNAAIMGRVSIAESCYIGANATIRQGISICKNVILGAGAVVTKDIVEPGTYVGIPARRIKQ